MHSLLDPSDIADRPLQGAVQCVLCLEGAERRVLHGRSGLLFDGPGPSDPLGLLRALRVSDWVSADGELTLTGRKALSRWLEQA